MFKNKNFPTSKIPYDKTCVSFQKNFFNRRKFQESQILHKNEMISRLSSRTIASRLISSHITACHVPEPIQQRRNYTNETVAGFWKTLSHSTPVAYVQEGLLHIHDYSGLPWWATIVLSTVVFRTAVTLPLAIYSVSLRNQPTLLAEFCLPDQNNS